MLTAVKRSLLPLVSVAAACAAAPALAQPPALQPLPAADAPPAEGATPAQAALPTPQQLYERVRKGVAVIERGGLPIAIGTVLGNDGRILTALSGLGNSDSADVLYADGTTVHAKLGHSDRETDLALLVPQVAKWTEGLRASEADPAGTELRAMLPARGGNLGPAQAGVKGRVDAHARDGVPLLQLLDVDVRGPVIAGTPLLDSAGGVVAVLVRACKDAGPQPQADSSPWAAWAAQAQQAKAGACTPAVFGAPVAAIRSFLAKTPSTATVPAPWLGIRGETETSGGPHGVRVVAVAPQSPAEKAGLKAPADVIVAVEGQPIETPEKLSEAISKHSPGETVKLLVYGQDKFREVPIALARTPQQ
jgi:serine protease Do